MAMTTYTPRLHEDYIEWIDNRLEILKEPLTALEVIAFSGITNVIRASLLANRAVLERHKGDHYGFCESCYEGNGESNEMQDTPFPCPTYTDTTKHLDEVMG